MTLGRPRGIYETDLQTRIDAAMARTRRLIQCSRAVRASVTSPHGTPFMPRCVGCGQPGRAHDSPPTSEQHYICAFCQSRWSL